MDDERDVTEEVEMIEAEEESEGSAVE